MNRRSFLATAIAAALAPAVLVEDQSIRQMIYPIPFTPPSVSLQQLLDWMNRDFEERFSDALTDSLLGHPIRMSWDDQNDRIKVETLSWNDVYDTGNSPS